jgi:CRISPR system Cascade subunit CasD
VTEFLLFAVYAPLASWGEITVGENRSAWDRPGRSAILGLIAAALGITRREQNAHDALDRSFGLAVRLDAAGSVLVDYQTVQSAAESEIRKAFGRRRPATRKQLLSVAERETLVSRRELREDALSTAALWTTGSPAWSLEAIKGALMRPRYTLYAGRKANVLGLPLAPQIVAVATLAEAFGLRPPGGPGLDAVRLLQRGHRWGREVAHDPLPPGVAAGLRDVRRETRRDAVPHRGRWQFSDRLVSIGLLPEDYVL